MENNTHPAVLGDSDVHVPETARNALASLIDDADEEYRGIRIYVQGVAAKECPTA
jgi:Fe-S cluster assembly iron-binding protein IscA